MSCLCVTRILKIEKRVSWLLVHSLSLGHLPLAQWVNQENGHQKLKVKTLNVYCNCCRT